ncbi:hypothetical protein ACLB2K_026218 [Fragaria x ananassa]
MKGNGFKFEAIWLAHEGFRPLVNGLWKQNLENDPFLNFVAICNQFKSQVKVWNKNVYDNLFKKIEDLNGRSNDIQQQLMLSPFSSYLQEQDLIVRKQLLQCYKDEEIFWAQKARANWLNLGDRNTKFFQTQTNMRKKSNTIVKLKNEVGGWATSREEISDILIKDFKRRFLKEFASNDNIASNFINIINPCINESDNELHMKQVPEEEIWDAVNSIGALKATWPDGLHAVFYQN